MDLVDAEQRQVQDDVGFHPAAQLPIPPPPRPKIDATLDLLTADEPAEVHRFVEVWERAGYMDSDEAAAWPERIAIWRRFRADGQLQVSKLADIPLLDDPDSFL